MTRTWMLAALAAICLAPPARSQAEPCAPGSFLRTIPNPAPAAFDYFGISVAMDGDLVLVGASGDNPIGSGDVGAAFVLDAVTGAVISTLSNPEPEPDDGFGWAVAIDGDLAVVGAYKDDPGGVSMAGSVYVFDPASGTLRATLNEPAPKAGDHFGYSVSVSQSLVLVGVREAGKAYVFDATTGTTGTLLATLNHPDPINGYYFGHSVAISGGLALVGDSGYEPFPLAFSAGIAYLFDAATGALLDVLNKPFPKEGDAFGCSVALSGDLALIGAEGDDSTTATFGAGRAYLFEASTGSLLSTMNNPDPDSDDRFGNAVAISEGFAIVGAFEDPGGGGAAYLFDTTTATTSTLLASLGKPSPVEADFRGVPVSISGGKAVIGSRLEDVGGLRDAGEVHIFGCAPGGPTPTMTPSLTPTISPTPTVSPTISISPTPSLTPTVTPTATATPIPCTPDTLLHFLRDPTSGSADHFANAVAISGDLAVVGAKWQNVGLANAAGTAYIFDAKTGVRLRTLANPTPVFYGEFGGAVAISGNRAVVGAPGLGAAYVFDPTTGALLWTLVNPEGGGYFGLSVSISGNLVVVGAMWNNPGGVQDAGAAYVFSAATGALVATLNNPAPMVGDEFGRSAAISGNMAVVGARSDDPGGVVDAGTAYVFDATTGALLRTLENPAPDAGDRFGWSAAIHGSIVVVGALFDESGGEGAAFMFDAGTGALLAKLNNPTPSGGDRYGVSVAISGNWIVVGAESDLYAPDNYSGTAYVFDATTGALAATLVNPAPASHRDFGLSVAVSGNVAVVGADYGLPSAFVFTCSSLVPTPTASLTPSLTRSPSPSRSPSLTVSLSRTPSRSPSLTESATPPGTMTGTPTPTPSPTLSSGGSSTPSVTASLTPNATSSRTALPSPSAAASSTPTAGFTSSRTVTPTASATASSTPSRTPSFTPSQTISASPSAIDSSTPTPTHTPEPPAIIRQPTSMKVNVGQGAAFLIEAAGAGPLAYQWFKGNQAIEGWTSEVYIIVDAVPGDAGAYHCEVTGASGTAVSNDATLTVFDPSAANHAQFGLHSAPPKLEIGQEVFVGVVMKNTSALTWSNVQGYALEVIDDPGGLFQGVPRFYLSDSSQVIPASGGFAQYVAPLRAPAAPGQYTARLRMAEENVQVFGEEAVITIQSVEPVNGAANWKDYE